MEDPTKSYSVPQRMLHWLTALLIFITIPVAFAMDGKFGKLSDAITGFLYDSHKLIGIIIFFVVVARLLFRLVRGAPPPEPSLNKLQHFAAAVTHWTMYGLLLAIPLGGYIALQYYGEIRLFGVLPIPSFDEPNKEVSERIFNVHVLAGYLLMALVGMHLAAVVFHRFVMRDNVLGRMWPSQLQRKG